ncbi:hypothetical protein DOK67_0000599 [Enterococcus sp. DIV0212c]
MKGMNKVLKKNVYINLLVSIITIGLARKERFTI